MHAEDFADHQHHGQVGLAFRLGAVGGHVEAAGRDGHFAGGQAVEVGLDGFGRHRQGRRREGGAQRGLDETPAIERLAGDEAFHFGLQHGAGSLGSLA
ncbi:hypothetical protein D3C87_1590430 [compost metagenome]